MKELSFLLVERPRAADEYSTPHVIASFWIWAVDSRNSVSLGGSLWKTTLDIDDLPLL